MERKIKRYYSLCLLLIYLYFHKNSNYTLVAAQAIHRAWPSNSRNDASHSLRQIPLTLLSSLLSSLRFGLFPISLSLLLSLGLTNSLINPRFLLSPPFFFLLEILFPHWIPCSREGVGPRHWRFFVENSLIGRNSIQF